MTHSPQSAGYQEGKTERAIEALRDLTSPRALVIRDGGPQRIAGSDVVRGDLMKLAEGDRVPADALLVSAEGVRADESLLTGEAVPVGKRVALQDERSAPAKSVDAPRLPPGGDDLPMVYAGTLIVQGHALARVTATGARAMPSPPSPACVTCCSAAPSPTRKATSMSTSTCATNPPSA